MNVSVCVGKLCECVRVRERVSVGVRVRGKVVVEGRKEGRVHNTGWFVQYLRSL